MITKLYEFVELDKIYPYEFKYKIHLNKKWADDEDCYVYEFKSKDGEIYNLGLFVDKDNELSMCWADKERFELMMNDKIEKFNNEKDPMSLNINYISYLLNTIFKIMFDFIKEHKIKCIVIGSYTKSKYKVYKKIIQDRPEFEIIDDGISNHENGLTFYRIVFSPITKMRKFFSRI